MEGIVGALYLPTATTTASKSYTSIRKTSRSIQVVREQRECTYFGPPSRFVRVTPGRLERLEPESPTLLLPSLVDSFFDTLYAGVVSSCRVFVIAVDVEKGCIGSNIIAKLIM